ncbi:MAG TPA: hypothetical protein VFN48_03145 [Solirubrobacteraceae bacterium]|nr:hypothetical protein [Solirubrobacteraceae bacterium]
MPNPQLAQLVCAPPILHQAALRADFTPQREPDPPMALTLLLPRPSPPP